MSVFLLIILIIIGIYLVFAVGPAIAVTWYLFSRKNYHNFVKKPEALNDPAYVKWKTPILENMEWMLEQPCAEVQVLSDEGFPLKAEWYDNGAQKTVIMIHGYRTTPYNNFSSIARVFLQRGWNVLLVWQRAHGKSGGRATTFGLRESRDPHRWVKWVEENVGGSIALYGISMGAASVAYASDSLLSESVSSLVIDCPYCRPFDQMLGMCKGKYSALKFLLYMIRALAKWVLKVDMMADIRESLRNTAIPAFFITGGMDATVPAEDVRMAHEACASEKELIIVSDATHTLSFLAGGTDVQERMFTFLDTQAKK